MRGRKLIACQIPSQPGLMMARSRIYQPRRDMRPHRTCRIIYFISIVKNNIISIVPSRSIPSEIEKIIPK
jgi:hypothetical protein